MLVGRSRQPRPELMMVACRVLRNLHYGFERTGKDLKVN